MHSFVASSQGSGSGKKVQNEKKEDEKQATEVLSATTCLSKQWFESMFVTGEERARRRQEGRVFLEFLST